MEEGNLVIGEVIYEINNSFLCLEGEVLAAG